MPGGLRWQTDPAAVELVAPVVAAEAEVAPVAVAAEPVAAVQAAAGLPDPCDAEVRAEHVEAAVFVFAAAIAEFALQNLLALQQLLNRHLLNLVRALRDAANRCQRKPGGNHQRAQHGRLKYAIH